MIKKEKVINKENNSLELLKSLAGTWKINNLNTEKLLIELHIGWERLIKKKDFSGFGIAKNSKIPFKRDKSVRDF